MIFATEKIKRTNKFNLDGLSAKKSVKRRGGTGAIQKGAIALFAGGLLALSGPGFDQWWLAWIMVAPLLVLLRFCEKGRDAILCGLCFGLGYNLVGLHYYWIHVFSVGVRASGWQMSAAVWVLQALALSLPTALFSLFVHSLSLRAGYIPYFKRPFFSYMLTVPLLWIFLHCGLAIARPLAKVWQFMPVPPVAINPLVYSQYCLVSMLQVTKYIGPAGLEYLILLVNTAVAALLLELWQRQERPVNRVDLLSHRFGAALDLSVVILIIGLVYTFGQNQIYERVQNINALNCGIDPRTEIGQPVLTIGLAANSPELPTDILSVGKALALIVYPERTAEISKNEELIRSMKSSASRNKNLLLANFLCPQAQGLDRHSLIFSNGNTVNVTQSVLYSKKVFLEDENKQMANLPSAMKEWLFVLTKESLCSWYALSLPKTRWGKLGLLTGSDISDSRLVANEVRRGASLLISTSDLSWTASKILNRQILAAAIFRAVENNRYVVLSTNDGVLSIIEPSGIIQSLSFVPQRPSRRNFRSILLGAVQFRWSKTPFTKMWWL